MGSSDMKAKSTIAGIFTAILSLVCHGGSSDQPTLILTASNSGDAIKLVLRNSSSENQSISQDFQYSGVNGGNLIGFIVTPLGQIAPPCVRLDTLSMFGDPVTLHPAEVRTQIVNISDIAKWHCLGSGEFTAVFAYQSASGLLVASDPVYFKVDK